MNNFPIQCYDSNYNYMLHYISSKHNVVYVNNLSSSSIDSDSDNKLSTKSTTFNIQLSINTLSASFATQLSCIGDYLSSPYIQANQMKCNTLVTNNLVIDNQATTDIDDTITTGGLHFATFSDANTLSEFYKTKGTNTANISGNITSGENINTFTGKRLYTSHQTKTLNNIGTVKTIEITFPTFKIASYENAFASADKDQVLIKSNCIEYDYVLDKSS